MVLYIFTMVPNAGFPPYMTFFIESNKTNWNIISFENKTTANIYSHYCPISAGWLAFRQCENYRQFVNLIDPLNCVRIYPVCRRCVSNWRSDALKLSKYSWPIKVDHNFVCFQLTLSEILKGKLSQNRTTDEHYSSVIFSLSCVHDKAPTFFIIQFTYRTKILRT